MTEADDAQRTERFELFRRLHMAGRPIVLTNVWDAGSAAAVERAGAAAIATGSWSVAGALGWADGEAMPFDALLGCVTRIVASVGLPVSVDVERGYADGAAAIAANVRRLVAAGAVGINFEDGLGGDHCREAADQADRIAAIAAAAGPALFVNARTDLFLFCEPDQHATRIDAAAARAAAYAAAGAHGFFAPGLTDPALIRQLADAVSLPLNIMRTAPEPGIAELAAAGAARISHGPGPWLTAMAAVEAAARAHLAEVAALSA